MQLDLPMVVGEPVPILYVQMDGTGVPVVKKETVGRQGKTEGQPSHTREVKLGCVFTQTTWDRKATRSAIRIPPPIRAPSRPPKSLASASTWKPGSAAGAARKRRSSWAMGPSGSGILPIGIFPARCRSSICITLASISGIWRASYIRMTKGTRKPGSRSTSGVCSTKEKSKSWWSHFVPSYPPMPKWLRRFAPRRTTFERNAERMRYPKFRRQHLFVGSGVIEAGCKTVIGSRLKQSGMFWTVRGANAIIALRCCHLNGRFEDYWEARRAA